MIENLSKLGFSEYFQLKAEAAKLQNFTLCRVTSVNKNSYTVSNGEHDIFAELTGKFLFQADSPLDLPTVGDWVYTQLFDDNSLAIIHEIVPRKSLLKRKTAGKKVEYQLIAANIDTAIIIQALDANYNLRRLERYLVMVHESHITPLILLSKSDLLQADEIEKRKLEIAKIAPDAEVLAFSNNNHEDVGIIISQLKPAATYCLLGSSGVGKTTLINNLLNQEAFRTQPIREKDGRGRHTTTRRELIVLENGAIIIDNPGIRELGVLSVDSGIDETFNEITELAANCRYADCTHISESGCAVLLAVEQGTLTQERYANYMKMYKESRFHEMSYQERKQREKQFGKLMHNYHKKSMDKRQN